MLNAVSSSDDEEDVPMIPTLTPAHIASRAGPAPQSGSVIYLTDEEKKKAICDWYAQEWAGWSIGKLFGKIPGRIAIHIICIVLTI